MFAVRIVDNMWLWKSYGIQLLGRKGKAHVGLLHLAGVLHCSVKDTRDLSRRTYARYRSAEYFSFTVLVCLA